MPAARHPGTRLVDARVPRVFALGATSTLVKPDWHLANMILLLRCGRWTTTSATPRLGGPSSTPTACRTCRTPKSTDSGKATERGLPGHDVRDLAGDDDESLNGDALGAPQVVRMPGQDLLDFVLAPVGGAL